MPRKNRGKHHEDFKLKDLIVNPSSGKDVENKEQSSQRSDVEDRLP